MGDSQDGRPRNQKIARVEAEAEAETIVLSKAGKIRKRDNLRELCHCSQANCIDYRRWNAVFLRLPARR
jgi:hypothetical protein